MLPHLHRHSSSHLNSSFCRPLPFTVDSHSTNHPPFCHQPAPSSHQPLNSPEHNRRKFRLTALLARSFTAVASPSPSLPSLPCSRYSNSQHRRSSTVPRRKSR
ncbi:hypothetical protein M758_UG320300 [Ceratodon purpureus]|nr:hypothetical protein M758_UG320300 [Ceratodon purpureus]